MKLLTAFVLLVACGLLPSASAAILRFSEIDYSLSEVALTRSITVEKTDANTGLIEFEVQVLTTGQFISMMGQFPPDLVNTTTDFDSAESADFDGTTLMGSFPEDPTPASINFNLTVTNDATNEATEVYILQIVITTSSENVTLENGGVSRVLILDNDAISIGFVLPTYSVQEDTAGFLDTLVFIQKEGGVVTEQVLTVFVQCADGSVMVLPPSLVSPPAVTGQDFTCTGGDTGIQVTFQPSDQMLAVIGILIVDDTVAEAAVENFQLQLSVPSAGGFSAGSPANVLITDNEFAVLGFEQTSYTFSETAGDVEVCFVINNGTFPAGYAFANLDSANSSATAPNDYISVVALLINLPTFDPPPNDRQRCETITIMDDAVCENNEAFTLTLTDPGFNPSNVMLVPAMATVTIDDNEDCDSMCPDPVDIANGTVTFTGNSVNDTATYTCNTGFELIGNATTTCTQVDMNTAAFQPAPPSCRPLCPNPPNIANGAVMFIGNSVGDTATYSCNGDFELIGNPVTTCALLPGGAAAAFPPLPPPSCQPECPDPPMIANGVRMFNGNSVGSMATYSCNPGFTLVGNPITICVLTDGGNAAAFPAVPPPACMSDGGMGGDPHYSVLLPTGQLLCFSVQGEKGFSFNLISNKLMHMNALFVQDSVRDEVTWIGSLGIVVRNTPYKKSKATKLRFVVEEKKIYIGEEVALQVQKIEKLTFSNGKLMINESSRRKGEKSPEVHVDLQDVGLSFKVRFTKSKHLDLSWERVEKQPADSHGMIGQFFRNGIEIDELRKLLLLPTMDPVPVMRKPVWHFMERETPEDQLCWVAMNPGYQGKRLIEGHYLDYLVNDVLSGDFKFKAKD